MSEDNALTVVLDIYDSLPQRWALKSEIERLRAIEEWARAQQPIKAGDRVAIADGFQLKQFFPYGDRHGWWSDREVLVPGAPGTAVRVDFSPHTKVWRVDYMPDIQWSVGSTAAHEHRYLKAEDKRNIFAFRMTDLVPSSNYDRALFFPGYCQHGCEEPSWVKAS